MKDYIRNGVEKERRGKKSTESARLVRAHGEYAVGITLEPTQKGSSCFLIARLPALRVQEGAFIGEREWYRGAFPSHSNTLWDFFCSADQIL